MPVDAGAARPRKERTENAAKRRRQLIEATIDSITRHGLSGSTLATIADAAGLSQGSAVFYFQTKERLFAETLRAHYDEYKAAWSTAYNRAEPNPVAHLTQFVLVDLSDEICSRRNITLWHAFWGEAQARPEFAEIANAGDQERLRHLCDLAERAAPEMTPDATWSPEELAMALDAMTDGLWMQMHIDPARRPTPAARTMMAQFIASAFPQHRELIFALANGAPPDAAAGSGQHRSAT